MEASKEGPTVTQLHLQVLEVPLMGLIIVLILISNLYTDLKLGEY